MTFQLIHYDVEIPRSEQPNCPECGGWMHIRIHPRTNVPEWACLVCTGVVPEVDAMHVNSIAAAGWPIRQAQGKGDNDG